jgi:hypothetical protein
MFYYLVFSNLIRGEREEELIRVLRLVESLQEQDKRETITFSDFSNLIRGEREEELIRVLRLVESLQR